MVVSNDGERNGKSESSSPPTYRFQRLQDRRSVRILELLPDKRGAPLKCHLREVKLDDAPSYEAVSYVWGAPDFVKQITCDTFAIEITKSCSYALHHLRLEEKARLLWIDACCINQKSEREQTQQVGMMGEIYSSAKRTLVWLGNSTGNDMSTMSYISRIGRNLSQDQGQSTDSTTGLIYAKTESRKPWYRHFVDTEEKKPTIADFNSLFSKPWFQRVWTVQEFALSRHCVIISGNICGITSMKAEHLMAFLVHNEEQTFLLSRLHRVHLHRKMRTYVRLTRDPHHKISDVIGCSQLLLGARAQSSTDPRDKIFAFQGILALLNIELPAPDYSKPVEKVYREAAAASIHHDFNLMLLSSLRGESKITGLPSWVPDWSNERITSELALWSENLATGTSRPLFRFSGGDELLTLRGTIIDSMDSISLTYPNPKLLQSGENATYTARKLEVAVLKQYFKVIGQRSPLFFSDFAQNAWNRTRESDHLGPKGVPYYWTAAVKALGPYDILENLLTGAQTWKIENPAEVRKLSPDATISRLRAQLSAFHLIVRQLLDRKALFTTRGGKFGIGYRSIKSGDSIALFAGCNLPMVIRPAGVNWRIVCPAYAENAMYRCEAWYSKEFPHQDFTFE